MEKQIAEQRRLLADAMRRTYYRILEENWLQKQLRGIQGLLNGMYLVTLNILEVQPLGQHLSHNLHKINELMLHMVEWKHFRITVYLHHFTIIGPPILEEIEVVAFTGLERMVVLNNHILHRNPLLLTTRELRLQLQSLLRHLLPLMQLQVRLPACSHILLNSSTLQLNTQVEHQVRTITLLRVVQTSVKKITKLVNRGLFSNQSVTLSMQRQKPNSG